MSDNEIKGPKFSPNIYKGVLLSIALSSFILPLGFVAMPYIEFFNGMAVQPKLKAQSHYGWKFGEEAIFDTRPVEGTIPRGFFPHPDELAGNDPKIIVLAGSLLENPESISKESLERGKKVYNTYCVACHGKLGYGDGSVTGPDRFPSPTSFHTDASRAQKDGSIYQIIANGKGNMMGYAEKIEPQDRWNVVNYVRALQRSQNPEQEDLE